VNVSGSWEIIAGENASEWKNARLACGASRGRILFFNVQLYIGRELSTVAVRAQVLRT
jgi:hypothetical protein